MPRLLKKTLPARQNPFKTIDDKVLAVIEYASLGYVLDRRGFTGTQKLGATIIIGIVYEMYILKQYGRIDGAKLSGDSEPLLQTRA